MKSLSSAAAILIALGVFGLFIDIEPKPAAELKTEIKSHYTGEITVVVPKGEDEEKKEAYLGPMVLKFVDGRLVSAAYPPEKEP